MGYRDSASAEANVANGFGAEAFFNFRRMSVLEIVVQSCLKNADIAVASAKLLDKRGAAEHRLKALLSVSCGT
jgi:hypothetical protein